VDDVPSSILFACTWNSVRSPMAAGIMKSIAGNSINIDSVGVHKGEIDAFTVTVLNEVGIDVSDHISKTFRDINNASFNLVISLSPEAQHSAVELTRTSNCHLEFWHTMDPSIIDGNRETRLDAYRNIRDQLRKKLLQRFSISSPPIV